MTLLSFAAKVVEIVTLPSRQHAAIAAYRISEGRCHECNVSPIDRDGTCDDCWVEAHAGP